MFQAELIRCGSSPVKPKELEHSIILYRAPSTTFSFTLTNAEPICLSVIYDFIACPPPFPKGVTVSVRAVRKSHTNHHLNVTRWIVFVFTQTK